MCPSSLSSSPTRRRSIVTYAEYRRGQKPPNYGRKFPPEVLTSDEVRRLLAACPRRGPSGLRNRALIVVLWRCGLRIAEALALEEKDIDFDAGTVTVLRGKGAKRRVVGIDPEALAVIQVWIDCRRRRGISSRAPLFCTIAESFDGPGHAIRSAYVRDALKRLGRKAGIAKRVHPHGLRHTHAYELANEGVPVHVIRQQLGHTSLAITDRYINHLAPVAVVKAMQARTWAPEAVAAEPVAPAA